MELVVDTSVDLQVEAPEGDDVADVFAHPRVDLVLRHARHGRRGGPLGFTGEPGERPGALGHGRQCHDVLVHGRRSEALLEPAEDDLGGREMVAEFVQAFIERFQLRETSGGASIPVGSTSNGDGGSVDLSPEAASISTMRRSSPATSSILAATPAPVEHAEHWKLLERQDRVGAAAAGRQRWPIAAEKAVLSGSPGDQPGTDRYERNSSSSSSMMFWAASLSRTQMNESKRASRMTSLAMRLPV